jgi:hypothetical protein
VGRLRKRLYFRMAYLASASLRWRKTGYNMDFLFALQNFFRGTFLNFTFGMDTLCRALAD